MLISCSHSSSSPSISATRAMVNTRVIAAMSYQPCEILTHPACRIEPAVVRPRRCVRRGGAMGSALAIRDDFPASGLRQLARVENDGRVACRLLALANALDGMSRAAA